MKMKTKSEWRAYALERREALSTEDRKTKSEQICRNIIQSSLLTDVHARIACPTVLVYWPFRSEVDIRPFITWAWQQSWIVAAPRVDRKLATMSYSIIHSPGDLHSGTYGIMEPSMEQPLLEDAASADVVIVPGAAFDRRGNRIGYGGGYYDKTFEQWTRTDQLADKQPIRIAPAYELQIFEQIPAEQHDIRVSVIITEKEEIRIDSYETHEAR